VRRLRIPQRPIVRLKVEGEPNRVWTRAALVVQVLATTFTGIVAWTAVCSIRRTAGMFAVSNRPWLSAELRISEFDSYLDTITGAKAETIRVDYRLSNYGKGAARDCRTLLVLTPKRDRFYGHTELDSWPRPTLVPEDSWVFSRRRPWNDQMWNPVYFHVLTEYEGLEVGGCYYQEHVFYWDWKRLQLPRQGKVYIGTGMGPEVVYCGRKENGRVVWDVP